MSAFSPLVDPEAERATGRKGMVMLLESFVESGRFSGAGYRAANWLCVGRTTGRGKLDRNHEQALPAKDAYFYPLRRDYRRLLSAPA